MKAVFFAMGLAVVSPAFADPVTGQWRTQPGDDGNFGVVEMAPCGTSICGTLVQAYDAGGNAQPSDVIGRQIVWDMQPAGGGAYEAGKVWAPDRDKTYRSKMALSGDVLKVSGCVGPFCREQIWVRMK